MEMEIDVPILDHGAGSSSLDGVLGSLLTTRASNINGNAFYGSAYGSLYSVPAVSPSSDNQSSSMFSYQESSEQEFSFSATSMFPAPSYFNNNGAQSGDPTQYDGTTFEDTQQEKTCTCSTCLRGSFQSAPGPSTYEQGYLDSGFGSTSGSTYKD